MTRFVPIACLLLLLPTLAGCGDDDAEGAATGDGGNAPDSGNAVDPDSGHLPDAAVRCGLKDAVCAVDASVDDGKDSGADGGLTCEQKQAAFSSYVATHQSCERDADCAVIGDCSPNADFTAVRADVAAHAYSLMQARCSGASDGPGYVARCTAGKCALEESVGKCCGCYVDQDAGEDAGSQ